MKIYIAAPWEFRCHAQEVMAILETAGHSVTSSWLKQDDSLPGIVASHADNDRFACGDLADVDACDLLMAINPPDYERAGTGGRHVELGYATARGKPIALIGHRSNIFHYLFSVQQYPTVGEFLRTVAYKEE